MYRLTERGLTWDWNEGLIEGEDQLNIVTRGLTRSNEIELGKGI